MTSIVVALTLTGACDTGSGAGPDADAGSDAAPAPVPDAIEEGERAPGAGSSSDCGGFEQGSAYFTSAATGEDVAYCDASMLYWTYDADTTTLRVRHTRTEMNCGAIPRVDLWLEEGVLQIVEKEILDSDPYGCQCVFDFDVRLDDVSPGQVPLEIWHRRHDEDAGKGMRIWNGTLDVSPGAGELVVSDEETYWCD